MPVDLTERQSDYLGFIRQYIDENLSAPQLSEIANNFDVKPTSAHKMLETLEKKGYITFNRDSYSGFYIRCFDKIGTNEIPSEIVISGKIDRYGEVYDFPEKIGHFPFVLGGNDPNDFFALDAWHHIPQVNILGRDILIFDQTKEPQPGDTGILPIGNSWYLVCFIDEETDLDDGRKLYWNFLADTGEPEGYFSKVAAENETTPNPIATEFVLATLFLLKRRLSM